MIAVYILVAIIILLVMIVIHELGHYVAGKIFKFGITEFSVGFGPKLIQRTSKKTGEKFTLRLIPLGGYCAFVDESGLESEARSEEQPLPAEGEIFPEAERAPVMPPTIEELREKEEALPPPRSFTEEKPWKRIIVLVSGALFNFVSAIIFTFIFICAVGYTVPEITTLYADDAGVIYASELQIGDRIVEVNGVRLGIMRTFDEETAGGRIGDTVKMKVIRGGEEIEVSAEVKRIVNTEEKLDYTGFGFSPQNVAIKAGVGYAFKYSVPYAGKLAWLILGTFGKLITGKLPLTSMSGPVGTVGLMAQLGMADPRNFLILLPLIAANLAIFNVLPIPALDGSKIVFTAIEWVRGKPVNRKVENIIHTVGLFLLFAFVIAVDLLGVIT